MAHLLRPDGTVLELQPKSGSEFSLEELQAAVGGYIEIVRHIRFGTICYVDEFGEKHKLQVDPNAMMIVNEEGHRKCLPLNKVATFIYNLDTTWPIVGSVLICRNKELR